MQLGDGGWGQTESLYQSLLRGGIWPGASATLQVRDAARAQSGLLRQFLLGQTNCQAVASQQLAE
jgi:hypothetical protein